MSGLCNGCLLRKLVGDSVSKQNFQSACSFQKLGRYSENKGNDTWGEASSMCLPTKIQRTELLPPCNYHLVALRSARINKLLNFALRSPRQEWGCSMEPVEFQRKDATLAKPPPPSPPLTRHPSLRRSPTPESRFLRMLVFLIFVYPVEPV